MHPCRIAQRTAETVSCTLSFPRTLLRREEAVLTLIPNLSAISLVLRPSAISSSTSLSRLLRGELSAGMRPTRSPAARTSRLLVSMTSLTLAANSRHSPRNCRDFSIWSRRSVLALPDCASASWTARFHYPVESAPEGMRGNRHHLLAIVIRQASPSDRRTTT